ncbi:MAG: hypothetical protein M3Q53_05555 [Actinomycetota bacterium]|nr:hypothetical protein [Actinomycetota bacterium]
MSFSKLSASELLGVVAAALLVIALFFMDWYSLAADVADRKAGDADAFICGVDEYSCTGWETFPIMRWLVLAAAIAPPILAYIVVRGHKLSWSPGELTMVLGFTVFVLIAYNGIIDPPGAVSGEIGITKELGYYIALGAAAGIAAGGIGRAMESQKGNLRKAPGTV